ncbi:hypothetical protein B4U80_11434 [Leptotrombidium deliense]|uniref:Uncharacterized protein n=1 Tax=Leptotrombidium deliense TaxID=299467 RepID=A0A443SQX1_9ACAR|nr:hypothetical protein B4U80_11434 [Leptotrombidium deliense]
MAKYCVHIFALITVRFVRTVVGTTHTLFVIAN